MTDAQTPPDADASWRCPSTHPRRPNAQCWYPVGHHGRDAVNDFDLHQDVDGHQWPEAQGEVSPLVQELGPLLPTYLKARARRIPATAPSTVES